MNSQKTKAWQRTESVVIRMTIEERALLEALTENERERLADEGIMTITSMTAVLVGLVVRESRERGISKAKGRK